MKRKHKIKLPGKVDAALSEIKPVYEALKKASAPFSFECRCTEITLAHVGCECVHDAEVCQIGEVLEAIEKGQILLNDALNLILSHCGTLHNQEPPI